MYRSRVSPLRSSTWQPTTGSARRKAFEHDTYGNGNANGNGDRNRTGSSPPPTKDGKAEVKEHGDVVEKEQV